MSKHWLTLIPVVLSGLPAVAAAQGAVTFSRTPLNQEQRRINIEELVDNEVDGATIELSWSVSGLLGGEWDYELTYGAITETSTQTTLVRVEEADAVADAIGDQPVNAPLTVRILLRNLIEDERDLPRTLGGQGRDDFDASICVNVYPAGNRDPQETSSDCWTFDVDTLGPPPPPGVSLVPGENRVQVSWDPIDDPDIEFYEVVYCVTATTADITLAPPCESEQQLPPVQVASTLSEASIQDGIRLPGPDERVFVVVAVRSIDDFDNSGVESEFTTVEPQEVLDFFELYDGDEQGGFCFMATAAFGSYAHPAVQVLRWFRDSVLMATPVGSAFVWAYYRYAPPLAQQVAADPALAGWIRLWLIPLAAIAILLMLCPLVAAGWLVRTFVRWSAPRWRQLPWAGLGLVLVLSVPSESYAKRPDSDLSLIGLGFEFKGGPYSGAIQNDRAFGEVFRDESRPLFTFGFDLQLYRGFGTVTAGTSFGFLQYTGTAPFAPPDEDPKDELEPSSDTNVFNLMPLTFQLGYRFDWLADRISWFPLVPYAKGGLAYYVWWSTDGIGNIQRRDEENGERQSARGGTFGVTGTLGVAFMLNKIDFRSAQRLFSNTGVRGTYVFVEMTSAQVDDFGGQSFNLSDFNWNVGLYMEL